jgi:hypothetical protein
MKTNFICTYIFIQNYYYVIVLIEHYSIICLFKAHESTFLDYNYYIALIKKQGKGNVFV